MRDSMISNYLNFDKIRRNLYSLYFVPAMMFTSRFPIGTNIYSEEWDLCVILDACRVDALREVQDEYEFINEIDRVLSLGSSSKEWMVNTFREEYWHEVSNTVYVTGNAWTGVVLDSDVDFSTWTVLNGAYLHSTDTLHRLLQRPICTTEDFIKVVIKDKERVGGTDSVPAGRLTDLAIQAGREFDPPRQIVHYMQPHAPYLHRAASGIAPTDVDTRPFELLRAGHNKNDIWNAYIDNLRYVLDHVETLLNNFDGSVVITSDHGEVFGDFGIYGHGEGIPHPSLRYVPWVSTRATDEYTVEPNVDLEEPSSSDLDEWLSAMGYK